MVCFKYDLSDQRVKYLADSDVNLGKLIKCIKTSELVIEEDGFKCLFKYIVGQQISDKARKTIWQRICLEFGNVTPEVLLLKKETELRRIGLTRRKVECIKDLAKKIVEEKINFEHFRMLSNEEIVTKLTNIKGIGHWTAEMYLIFSLGREDVLSKGDGTIKRVIQWMYDLNELPSAIVIEKYFVNWREYATIVSLFLWRAIDLGLTKKPFCEAISEEKGYV